MSHYTDDDVKAAENAVREHGEWSEKWTPEAPRCIADDVLTAVADAIANRAAGRALRIAAADPHARLSGHSGVSVRWLRAMADEIERGAL